jgi:fatty acid desaturase
MTEQINSSPTHYIPWASRAAFPIVKVAFYATQFVLGYCVYREWWVISVILTLLLSHFMHGLLIGFHEASHGLLRKNKFFNEVDGVLVGILSYTPFTLYRALHQKHHLHLATEKDLELWPYVMTDSPRWKRRLVAFLELNFGLFFIPYLFLRAFFQKDSPVQNRKVRKRVWIEVIGAAVFWAGILFMCAHFNFWPWFFFLYFIPALIAGNLQSWRKYIEHVGLSGNTSRSATRSIIANTWLGRLTSMTLLHEPLHGIHHTKMSLHHYELPEHIELLEPEDEGDTHPYPNYRSAFVDLFVQLRDPKVGSQWNTAADSARP